MDMKPRVGIGVFVIKEDKILFGKRKNAHGQGSWCFPEGHLEFGETLEQCARRETLEETGLQITNIRKGPYTNDIFQHENKHYITIFMIADYLRGDVRLLEPEKCERWQWFAWHELPTPLFLPLQNLINEGFTLSSFHHYENKTKELTC